MIKIRKYLISIWGHSKKRNLQKNNKCPNFTILGDCYHIYDLTRINSKITTLLPILDQNDFQTVGSKDKSKFRIKGIIVFLNLLP